MYFASWDLGGGGGLTPPPQILSLSTAGRTPQDPGDQITDGPLGLPPPGPHHTSLSAKFHPEDSLKSVTN